MGGRYSCWMRGGEIRLRILRWKRKQRRRLRYLFSGPWVRNALFDHIEVRYQSESTLKRGDGTKGTQSAFTLLESSFRCAEHAEYDR